MLPRQQVAAQGPPDERAYSLVWPQRSGPSVTAGLSHPCAHLLSSLDLGFRTGQCRLCCRHAHLASVSKHPDQLGDPEGAKKCLLISWQSAALTLMNSRVWPGCSGKPGLCLEHWRSQVFSMCKPSSSLHQLENNCPQTVTPLPESSIFLEKIIRPIRRRKEKKTV